MDILFQDGIGCSQLLSRLATQARSLLSLRSQFKYPMLTVSSNFNQVFFYAHLSGEI